jgi:hypothetical protein
MKSWGTGSLPIVAAVVLLAAVTALQGLWTERWNSGNTRQELLATAASLEANFPEKFGDWQVERELESNPRELEVAGAVGHISRLYRNIKTNALISTFVVCATPHHASGHTPDRCYPGAGFEIAEEEHRQSVPLSDGRTAETFTGTFRKSGQTLRIFWTYGVDGTWVAPQIARIELAGKPAVNKLYAIVDETGSTDGESIAACCDFLAQLLPVFDQAVVASAQKSLGAGGDPSTESGGNAGDASSESPAAAESAAAAAGGLAPG